MLVAPTRKSLPHGALPVFWRVLHCLLLLFACSFGEARAQVFTGVLVGSLQTTGEVYLDETPAIGEQTVFTGEDIRTGAGGVAALTVAGTGVFNVASQTEISLGAGQPLVTLKQGTVAARSFQSGKGLQIRFGSFVVHLPFSEGDAAVAVTLGLDGSAKVECLDGGVVLVRSQGTEAVNLRLGQSVKIDADGKVRDVETIVLPPTGSGGQPPTSQVPTSSKSRAAALVLGVGVAAAGIGVSAAALSHHSGSKPISPSAP